MPNWCDNELVVEGDQHLLQQFYDENGKDSLSFAKAVPEQAPTCESHYFTWGTKWDASDVIASFDESLTYTFRTAWSPPEPWFLAIVEKYPLLRFTLEYNEPMMDFEGILEGENGEITENIIWSYTEIRWDELLDSGVVDRYVMEHASNELDDIAEFLAGYNFNDDYAYVMEGRIEQFRDTFRHQQADT